MEKRRINSDITRVIGENQIAFTNSTSTRPVLLTYGVIGCMVLILKNPATKEAGMMHSIDFDQEAVEWFIGQMAADGTTNLEAKIVGGLLSADNEKSRQHYERIDVLLSKNKIRSSSPEIFDGQQHHNFGIDSRDGGFFYNENDDKLIGELIQDNIRERKYPGDEGHGGFIGIIQKHVCEFDGRKAEHQARKQHEVVASRESSMPRLHK